MGITLRTDCGRCGRILDIGPPIPDLWIEGRPPRHDLAPSRAHLIERGENPPCPIRSLQHHAPRFEELGEFVITPSSQRLNASSCIGVEGARLDTIRLTRMLKREHAFI